MKIASLFGHNVKQTLFNEVSDFWPLPRCNVGLEWEFENGTELRQKIAQLRGNPFLSIHDDGSLRDNGVEIVTQGDGLFGRDILEAIRLMHNTVLSCKIITPVCNFRTGFHVHLDIRDLEDKELHNLLLLYCLIERPLFDFVGRDRWASNFSVPWFRSDAQFGVLKLMGCVEKFNRDNFASVSQQIKGLQRYAALNCQAVAKQGSIEFRHMQNDIAQISNEQLTFISCTMKLKKAAIMYSNRGMWGEALFNHCKNLTKEQLIEETDLTALPIRNWDYGESLMLAIGLVNFDETEKLDTFFDMAFEPFLGRHPCWR